MRTFGLTLAAVAVSAVTPARGADFNMGVTADGIKLGNHVLGPTLKPEDLKGKVVVLEFWGVKCPPCLASLPKVSALSKELAPAGLVVIGAHAQGGPVDDVRKVATDKGVGFTVVESASVQGGADFSGIPHAMVFDHTGKCLFRGSPFDMEKVVREAVAKAPAGILGGRELVKLAGVGKQLKAGTYPGTVLVAVKKQTEAKDAATADEARFVVEAITGAADRHLAAAKAAKEDAPGAALAGLDRLVREFAGTDAAGEAKALAAEWRKDKEFLAEIKAFEALGAVKKAAAQIRVPAGTDPKTPEFRKANAAALAQLNQAAAGLRRNYPKSKAAAQAADILSQFGLSTP